LLQNAAHLVQVESFGRRAWTARQPLRSGEKMVIAGLRKYRSRLDDSILRVQFHQGPQGIGDFQISALAPKRPFVALAQEIVQKNKIPDFVVKTRKPLVVRSPQRIIHGRIWKAREQQFQRLLNQKDVRRFEWF